MKKIRRGLRKQPRRKQPKRKQMHERREEGSRLRGPRQISEAVVRLKELLGLIDVPAPSRAVARKRIRSKPGFLSSLGAEVREMIANYDESERAVLPRR